MLRADRPPETRKPPGHHPSGFPIPYRDERELQSPMTEDYMHKQSYRDRPTDTPARDLAPRPITEWLALVRRNRNISGETRALLQTLGRESGPLSVPELAEMFAVSERTIRGRLAEARRAGLLPIGGAR